jgi:uncharacterized lipoprotein YddW (UPF0748 family)
MNRLLYRLFSSFTLLAGCAAPMTRAQPAAQPQAPAEVRGTWVTTTGNDAVANPANSAATMKRLREIGLNTVYVECWKNGYTEWPSDAMKQLVGVPMKVNGAPANLQRDLVQETTIEAHRNGLVAIAWMEYGFMASYKDTKNELRALGLKEGWLTTNQAGEVVGKQNAFVWMNPLHPKPQQLLIDLAVELVTKYDVDGVQLDDRIAMPVEMGYDPYTTELYRKEHNGQNPPENHRDPAWVQWRADKITEYAKRFAREVRKAAGRDIIVSVSPAPYPWSLENYCCDWPKWTKFQGDERWDEYVPQNYRMNGEATIKSIQQCVDAIPADAKKLLYGGIRLVGDGPDMPAADIKSILDYTRSAQIGGHVHWFSRGVLNVFPNELTAYYGVARNGPAPHPLRPNHRKPAVAAEKQGAAWHARDVTTATPLIWIVKKDGRWSYGPRVDTDAKPILPDAGYEAAELIPYHGK